MRPIAIKPAPALTAKVNEMRWNCGVRSISLEVKFSRPDAAAVSGGTNPSGSQPSGGIFIQTETPLCEHSALKMRFRLPGGGTTHEIEGRVVWRRRPHDPGSHSPGMGIEFTDRAATAILARELETLK